MTRESLAMLELTHDELLVLTLQGVVAKTTLLSNIRELSKTEHELGAMAAMELIKHLDAGVTLNDKVTRAAATMLEKKYV
jgi:kynureninase